MAQPVLDFKLQSFPYFVYYMSPVIDFYPWDLDILSARNNLSIEAYGKRNLNLVFEFELGKGRDKAHKKGCSVLCYEFPLSLQGEWTYKSERQIVAKIIYCHLRCWFMSAWTLTMVSFCPWWSGRLLCFVLHGPTLLLAVLHIHRYLGSNPSSITSYCVSMVKWVNISHRLTVCMSSYWSHKAAAVSERQHGNIWYKRLTLCSICHWRISVLHLLEKHWGIAVCPLIV